MISLYGFPQEQLPLPLDLPQPEFTRKTLGLLGELTVLREFARAGYDARRAPVRHGDVRLVNRQTGEIIDLEVKTARRGADGAYRFTLYRKLGRVCTDYRRADYLVLLAVVSGSSAITFVIPTSDLNQQSIAFNDPERTRKFSPYRQNLATWGGNDA